MNNQKTSNFLPRLREKDKKREVFCVIRKKFVAATPEEFVRQQLLHYLINSKKYPAGLLSVEKSLKVNGMTRRPDVVAFSHNLKPLLICECKAPKIPINQSVFDQAAAYNSTLNAKALLVTNGSITQSCLFNYSEKRYIFFKELPSYKELDEI